MKLRDRLALIRQAFRPTAATETVTDSVTVPDTSAILKALHAAGAIPPGYRAEVRVPPPRPETEPPRTGPKDWHEYRTLIENEETAGWTVCRMGGRIDNDDGADGLEWYYGIVRDNLGVYSRPFNVCHEESGDSKSFLLTTLCHIPTGIGLGLFNGRHNAIAAADLVLDPRSLGHVNRWAALPKHDVDTDDKQQMLAWHAHMEWMWATWKFNGIGPIENVHAHTTGGGPPLTVWARDEANLTAGKPEKVS